MNSLIILQQIFVLFAMMATGYLAFRARFIDRIGQHQISSLVANILNPFVILSSIAGERPKNAGAMMKESLILAFLYYAILLICSWLYVWIRRPQKRTRALQQLMLIFSNAGFFVIPLVRALFGDAFIIYLVFYILLFNVLTYTLGIYLAIASGDGGGAVFTVKKIINPGTVTAVIALLLFLLNVDVPGPLETVFSYLGNACIPLSMILIGASLAQLDLKTIILSKENWIFTAVKMFIVPTIGILIGRSLPFSQGMKIIFYLEMSMPVAAIAGVFAEEYAHRGNEVNQLVALTTLVALVSVPLLSLLY